MAKTARRPQRQKTPDRVRRVQGLRTSGAAGVHAGQGEYRRWTKSDIDAELSDWEDYDTDF